MAMVVMVVFATDHDTELLDYSRENLPKFELKKLSRFLGNSIIQHLKSLPSNVEETNIQVDNSLSQQIHDLCLYLPRIITDKDSKFKLRQNHLEAFVDFYEKVVKAVPTQGGIANSKGQAEIEFSRQGLNALSLIFMNVFNWMSEKPNSVMNIELAGFKKYSQLGCRVHLRNAIFSESASQSSPIKRFTNYFIGGLDKVYETFKDTIDNHQPITKNGKKYNAIVASRGDIKTVKYLLCLMPIFLPESRLKTDISSSTWSLFLDLAESILKFGHSQPIEAETNTISAFLNVLAGAQEDLSRKRSQDVYRALGLLPCEDYNNAYRQDIESIVIVKAPSIEISSGIDSAAVPPMPSKATKPQHQDQQYDKEKMQPSSKKDDLVETIKTDLLNLIRHIRQLLDESSSSKLEFILLLMKRVPLKSIKGMLNALYIVLPSNKDFFPIISRIEWDKFFDLCRQLINSSDETTFIMRKKDAELFSRMIQMLLGFDTWNNTNVSEIVKNDLNANWYDFLKNFLPEHAPPSSPPPLSPQFIEHAPPLSPPSHPSPQFTEYPSPPSMLPPPTGGGGTPYKCKYIRALSQIEAQTDYIINNIQNRLKISNLDVISINFGIPQLLVLSNLFNLMPKVYHTSNTTQSLSEIERRKLDNLQSKCNQIYELIKREDSASTYKTLNMNREDAQLLSRFLHDMTLSIANTPTRTFLNLLQEIEEDRSTEQYYQYQQQKYQYL